MKVESREYKFLITHEMFADPDEAVRTTWEAIRDATNTLPKVGTKGAFDDKETRMILFLDTPDQTLRRNGLVLRQRTLDDAVEYTLKCRSEDRHFAAGTNVGAAEGVATERKFEEDIAPPFRCRFSQSATITESLPTKTPTTVRKAAALFPVLGKLQVNRQLCAPETDLIVVNNISVQETVWKGGKLSFEASPETPGASIAFILWTRGKEKRPAIAELSFRIKESEERFSRDLAEATRAMYALLLRLDCARRDGMTKTEYIYRDALAD